MAATIKPVRQQLRNPNITGRLPVKLAPDLFEWMRQQDPVGRGLYAHTVQRPVTITLLGAVSGAGKSPGSRR
ncbi:capsule biosynthesis GfcC D2 domain-containing protein [Escherichia coli]